MRRVCLQRTESGGSCWSPSCVVQAAPPAMAALLLEDLCVCPKSSLLRGVRFQRPRHREMAVPLSPALDLVHSRCWVNTYP